MLRFAKRPELPRNIFHKEAATLTAIIGYYLYLYWDTARCEARNIKMSLSYVGRPLLQSSRHANGHNFRIWIQRRSSRSWKRRRSFNYTPEIPRTSPAVLPWIFTVCGLTNGSIHNHNSSILISFIPQTENWQMTFDRRRITFDRRQLTFHRVNWYIDWPKYDF